MDNPEHYLTLYASDAPAGAVAEAFGNHETWTPQLLAGRSDLPGSARALATLDAGQIQIVDLDDPRCLVERSLRPSAIVSRDRGLTQSWALRVFGERKWSGARWWSHYDSRWGSYGLWDLTGVRVLEIAPLTADHSALVEAAAVLSRPWRV